MSELPDKPRTVDGATLRLYRSIQIAKWLKLHPATFGKVRAYAYLHFGLSERATRNMLCDMENARIVRANGLLFKLTKAGEDWLKDIEKKGEFK